MMTTILSNLNQRLAQLEAGDLTAEEMEFLVEDAKELYERLVILRYKIYETNVLGPRPIKEESSPVSVTEMEEEVQLTETPSFDLFEVPIAEETIEISMDFTPDETMEEEPASTLFMEHALENEIKEEALPEQEEEMEHFKEEIETESFVENEAPTFEEESMNFVEEEEILDEQTLEEEPIDSGAEAPKEDTINSAWIQQIEQTIRSDRSVFPLETLIGSFSLNEKLQFINDLFDGSSDAFSTATKKLDACASMSEARTLLTEFSATYSWDLESEIVEDFIFKICRRYATSAS